MIKRNFIQPTNDEIREREKMYEEADSLGIDLMGYDSDHSSMRRQDRRKAVVLLGTGKPVPKELKEKLTNDTMEQNRQKNEMQFLSRQSKFLRGIMKRMH